MFSKFVSQKLQQQDLNYKNILLLRKFISPEGKILPRRLTGLNTKQQRTISKAIKNARIMGFLPFIRIALY
uniref:Small ribosomal subunit protein bS18c n=2 Tax=Bryopsidineae TaxID=2791029 RepID=A0A0D6E1F4_BRYPL|nr:ribosomal protein S18 [Bryopsis plumosa]AJF21963.1 ribosomal protein S18 [Codium decorticatum]CEO91044.1 ribosomal protein S18 [Bryopsis plumosa]